MYVTQGNRRSVFSRLDGKSRLAREAVSATLAALQPSWGTQVNAGLPTCDCPGMSPEDQVANANSCSSRSRIFVLSRAF